MNIFTPVLIVLFGTPLLITQWAVRKLTGKVLTEGQAWGVLFTALLVTLWVSGWWLAPS